MALAQHRNSFRHSPRVFFLRNLGRRPLLFETDTAQHRPALCRLEGNRRRFTALRAVDACLWAHPRAPFGAFRLALFAVPRIVLELFVVEEQLFASCKHKLSATIDALQISVRKFHIRLPQRREPL